MKNQFGASAKLAIGTVLFTVIIFFQNCSDIQVSRVSGPSIAEVPYEIAIAANTSANTIGLFIRVRNNGAAPVFSGNVDWTVDTVERSESQYTHTLPRPPNCTAGIDIQAEFITNEGEPLQLETRYMDPRCGITDPDPEPPPPGTFPVPGTGSPAQNLGGYPLCANNPYQLEQIEPPQPSQCQSAVNWVNNKVNGVLTRDTRWTTLYAPGVNAGNDMYTLLGSGLPVNSFFSFRLKGVSDLQGAIDDVEFYGQADHYGTPYRPVQAVVSECVGDFGTLVTTTDVPTRRAAYGPQYGRCGTARYNSGDNQFGFTFLAMPAAEIPAYVAARPPYLVSEGPCILEEGKTYYINVIQALAEDVNTSICDQYQMIAGAGGPQFISRAQGAVDLVESALSGNYVYGDGRNSATYIPPAASNSCYFWMNAPGPGICEE